METSLASNLNENRSINHEPGESGEDATSQHPIKGQQQQQQQQPSFMKTLQSNNKPRIDAERLFNDSDEEDNVSDSGAEEDKSSKIVPSSGGAADDNTNTEEYMRRISDEDRKLEEREEKVKQELDLVKQTLDDAEKRLLDMKARFDALERETDQLSKRIAEFAADEEHELTKLKDQIDKDYPAGDDSISASDTVQDYLNDTTSKDDDAIMSDNDDVLQKSGEGQDALPPATKPRSADKNKSAAQRIITANPNKVGDSNEASMVL